MPSQSLRDRGIRPPFDKIGGVGTARKIKIRKEIRQSISYDGTHTTQFFVYVASRLVFRFEVPRILFLPDLLEQKPAVPFRKCLHGFQPVHEFENPLAGFIFRIP